MGVQVIVTAVKPVTEPVDPNATATETPTVDPSATPTAVAGEFTAVTVHVVPGKPEKIHRVGVVTVYEAGKTITIEGKDGELYTFELSDTTKILPEERVDLAGRRRQSDHHLPPRSDRWPISRSGNCCSP